MLVLLYVLAAAAILGLLGSYIKTENGRLYLTPIFNNFKGWDIYTFKDGIRTDLTSLPAGQLENISISNTTLYFSRVLTQAQEDAGYTFLMLENSRPYSVFLDGCLYYTTSPEAGQEIGEITFPTGFACLTGRGESIRCTLPAGFAGKTLTIATFRPDSTDMLPSIKLSSEAVETKYWMGAGNQISMPAAAFAAAALLLLGLLFYSLYQGGRDFSLLLLAVTAIIQLLYLLREYDFVSPSLTALDTRLALFFPCLNILVPELFLLLHMKRMRNLCAVTVLAAAAVSAVFTALNIAAPKHFYYAFSSYILAAGFLTLLVFAVLEAREKNPVFILFFRGLGILCAGIPVLFLVSQAGDGYYADYILTLLFPASPDIENHLYWCGTGLFLLAVIISISVLFHRTAQIQTTLAVQQEQAHRLDYELSVQKQFYEARLTGEEELRAIRHDMKSHLATLSALLSDSRVPEAVQYLERLTEQVQTQKSEVFCGNPYVNAVLETFLPRFRKNRIPFTCRCGVDNRPLPGMEISLILNNALENALESSLHMPPSERDVKLQATIRFNQLLLRISNRFDGTLTERGGLPVTSKPEAGHGYGLANIRSTAGRLGGRMAYRVEEGYFILDVSFPLEEVSLKGGANHAV